MFIEKRQKVLQELKENLAYQSILEVYEDKFNILTNKTDYLHESKNLSIEDMLEYVLEMSDNLSETYILLDNKEDYFKLLEEKASELSGFSKEDISLNLESLAEDVINNFTKNSSQMLLAENSVEIKENEDEVKSEIIKKSNELKESMYALDTSIEKFYNLYINTDKNKLLSYLTDKERNIVNTLLEIASTYKDFFKTNVSNKILSNDIEYLSDMDNKLDIFVWFEKLNIAIRQINGALIGIRILLCRNTYAYGIKNSIDNSFTVPGDSVPDIYDNLRRILELYSSCRNMNRQINTLGDSENLSVLRFVIKDAMDVNKLSNLSKDVFTRQSSLSSKYLHHIHQLFIDAHRSIVFSTNLIDKLYTLPLNKIITNGDINGVAASFNTAFKSLLDFHNHSLCYLKTSTEFIKDYSNLYNYKNMNDI